MLAGCYWFCILIWISSYTANLAAFLTVKNTKHPISNLEDAINSDYNIGTIRASATYEFFKSSEYELYQNVWRKMAAGNAFANNTQEGIEWARRKDFIYISDGPVLEYEANRQPCDLVTSAFFQKFKDRFTLTTQADAISASISTHKKTYV